MGQGINYCKAELLLKIMRPTTLIFSLENGGSDYGTQVKVEESRSNERICSHFSTEINFCQTNELLSTT